MASGIQGGLALHLDEAIHLYILRKPLYAEASGGRTDPILGSIIFNQKLFRWIAPFYDWRALKFQQQGIPVLDRDFVSMNDTPAFVARADRPWPTMQAYHDPDHRSFVRRIGAAIRARDFASAEAICRAELEQLREPRFNCMYRHFVESLGRMSHLAPQYIKAAAEKGCPSPASLSAEMLKLHLWYMPKTVELDRRAAPIQADGIPFLQNDVPSIPVQVSIQLDRVL